MNIARTKLHLVFIGLLAAALAGCSQTNNLASTPQGQALIKTNQIVVQSGGDWNKLSESDKQFLISGPGHGSEQQARQFLAAEASRTQAGAVIAGGPPKSPPAHTPAGSSSQGGTPASTQ